jgi:hypothetical protein
VRLTIIVSLCACLGLAADARADHGKIDRLEMVNGDTLTCEVISLDHGKLTVKTDGLGTLSVEWGKVQRVVSPASYQVELSSGRRMIGSIDSPVARRLAIRTVTSVEVVDLADVVRMAQLESRFWKQLDGSIDFGFNFAQADSLTQLSLNTTVSRRTAKFLTQGRVNSQITTDSSVSHQKRHTLGAQLQRFLGHRWFVAPLAQFSQNEQLGLDFRSILGGAVGRYVAQSNRSVLSLIGGVTYTHEKFTDQPGDERAEAVAIADWDWFTFGDRETTLSTVVQLYYNIGSESRTRSELNTSFRRKLFRDFYASLNVLESFDSAPPAGERKNDVSVTASVGWSF